MTVPCMRAGTRRRPARCRPECREPGRRSSWVRIHRGFAPLTVFSGGAYDTQGEERGLVQGEGDLVTAPIPPPWAIRCMLAFVALLAFASAPAAETGVRLDGPRTQGGLLRGRVAPGSAVELGGVPVRVSRDGWFLIGFGRDAPPEAELAVVFPDGRRERRILEVEPREYRIQRIDGLPARKVTPRSEEDLARIRAEVGMVKKARTIDDPAPISSTASAGRSRAGSAVSTARSASSTASRAGRTTASTSRRRPVRGSLRRPAAWSRSRTRTCSSPAAP